MEHPMESKEKSSHLFYLIIVLIVLGFITSLAFPINAHEHKLSDTSRFAEHFVPATDNSRPATETAKTETPATSSTS
jgi:hypothetical protein